MDLFLPKTPKAEPAKIEQIKTWIYQLVRIDSDISISIIQLRCTEPDCPPLETVIAVMETPVRQYKIHKQIDDINCTDIAEAIQGNTSI